MDAVVTNPLVNDTWVLECQPIIPEWATGTLGDGNNRRVVNGHPPRITVGARWNGTQYWNHPRGYAFLHNRRQLRAKGIYIVVALQIVGAVHNQHNAGLFAFELTQQRRVVGGRTAAGEWVEHCQRIIGAPPTVGTDTIRIE